MTDLEKIRNWITLYPGADRLQSFRVDYYETTPNSGTIAPAGMEEFSRDEDVLGNVIVEDRYSFGLYFTLAKAQDDADAIANADWVLGFQQWVQEQSIRHLAPTFGDDPQKETIKTQNGEFLANNENGTATYRVLLNIHFKKFYEVI